MYLQSKQLESECSETSGWHPDREKLLSRLCVDVACFSVLEVGSSNEVAVPATGQFTILYIVEGRGLLECSGQLLQLNEGTVVIIPQNIAVFLQCDEIDDNCAVNFPGLVVATSKVSATAGHGLGYFENLKAPLVEGSNDVLLTLLFRGILEEFENPRIGSKCVIEALMKQVLVVLLRQALTQKNAVTPLYLTMATPNLAQVINTIHESHAERLSIPFLANMVGMTPLGLNREFERVFGETLLEYIQGVRLYQAATLLTQTDLPIKCIAANVGFASRSHFSRAFRKHQGEDPTAFRRKHASGGVEQLQT